MRAADTRFWGRMPADCAPRLAGAWKIARIVHGPDARLTGRACFTPISDGVLLYREIGRLELATGESLSAERRYRFTAHERGFQVHFDEMPPRLFHDVTLSSDNQGFRGAAHHRCGDDFYETRYLFHGDGTFETVNLVSGPRKNYAMVTRYVRAAGSGAF